MPTFWSCGLRPRPSAGVNGSRSNGFEPNSMTLTKNATTADVTPGHVRHQVARSGAASAAAPGCANSDSTTAQKSSEPFWPAQKADTM